MYTAAILISKTAIGIINTASTLIYCIGTVLLIDISVQSIDI